jgi:hypothetical protein
VTAINLNFLGTSTLLGKKVRLKESRQSANVGRRAAISLIALFQQVKRGQGSLGKPRFAGLRWPGSTRVVVIGQGITAAKARLPARKQTSAVTLAIPKFPER